MNLATAACSRGRRHWLRLAIPLLVLEAFLLPPPEAQANVAQIKKLWKAREAKFKSGRITWQEEKLTRQGFITSAINAYGPAIDKSMDVIPSTDVTHTYNCILTFSGDKLRYSTKQPTWATSENKYILPLREHTWNGATGALLQTRESGAEIPHYANLYPRDPMIRMDMHVAHFLTYYRSSYYLDAAFPLSSFVPAGQRTTADGRKCLALREHPSGVSRVGREAWIDMTRDASLERVISTFQGVVVSQLDLTYKHDLAHGWILTGWRRTENDRNGSLTNSVTAIVLESEFNVTIDPGEFEAKFPPGTYIADEVDGRIINYIVRDDGTRRPVLPQEHQAELTYADLVRSDPGKPPAESAWTFIIYGMLLVVPLAFLAFSYIRSKNRNGHTRFLQ